MSPLRIPSPSRFAVRSLTTLGLLAMLAACGGGGDGAAVNSASGTITVPTPTACSLTANTGTVASDAITRVNFYRAQVGLPALTVEPKLTVSSGNHANYLSLLSSGRAHTESSGNGCFTGTNIITRVAAANYITNIAGEEFAEVNFQNGADTVDALFDAIYHRMGLLANFAKIGAAWQTSSFSPPTILVMNIADTGTAYTPTTAITYPAANQTGIKADWFLNEIPCPLGCGMNGQRVGYPISLQTGGTHLQVTSFTLNETAGGASVAGTVLSSTTDANLPSPSDRAAFIPTAALKLGTTYTAQLVGTLDGSSFTRTWQFTTLANSTLVLSKNVSANTFANGQSFDVTFSGGSGTYRHVTSGGAEDTLGWTYTATASTDLSPVSYTTLGHASYRFTNNGRCTVATGCTVTFTGHDSFGQAANLVVTVMP